MDLKNVNWIGHASFLLKLDGCNLFIDPVNLSDTGEKADLILITHAHFDHLSKKDIEKIMKEDTEIFCPYGALRENDYRNISFVRPGFKKKIGKIEIETVPAYNTNEQRLKFHPKLNEGVGYVLEIEGKRIYHAGDTDFIEEMRSLKNIYLALLPAGGIYTMDVDEAIAAANAIGAEYSAPMHYKNLVGEKRSVELEKKFKDSVKGAIIFREIQKPTYSFK